MFPRGHLAERGDIFGCHNWKLLVLSKTLNNPKWHLDMHRKLTSGQIVSGQYIGQGIRFQNSLCKLKLSETDRKLFVKPVTEV